VRRYLPTAVIVIACLIDHAPGITRRPRD